ncbi:MAG: hemerythrin domain-containing protein [Curvibacter lanceolatus]|uniref:hemerythrin domain-containing protein n=1 Tax=Curvibacter lanceolatus TaxID=86182 RepID=UPI0006884318|nr:hemerythrin domain-containing protein [Curvibacter lanceolatus]MBV5291854.1 hemerythrin domain-containing protein [Curvibacter lanceolatus]
MSSSVRLANPSLLPGRPGPDAGFAAPYEMLAACHDKVQRMLDLLERLQAHLREQGPDSQAAQAARDVMRYFDLAAPLHHEDEERHVFPLLLHSGNPAWVALAGRLQQEHRDMAPAWAALRQQLERVAAGQGQSLQAEGFASLYRAHLRAEDELAYPAALRLGNAVLSAEMGRDMMQRRGWPGV